MLTQKICSSHCRSYKANCQLLVALSDLERRDGERDPYPDLKWFFQVVNGKEKQSSIYSPTGVPAAFSSKCWCMWWVIRKRRVTARKPCIYLTCRAGGPDLECSRHWTFFNEQEMSPTFLVPSMNERNIRAIQNSKIR